MRWRIYYADGSRVEGSSPEDWRAAPDVGVQVVVLMEPGPMRWYHAKTGPIRDRQLWTGDDEYDPFGWGKKRGSLIEDGEYDAIWERACVDP